MSKVLATVGGMAITDTEVDEFLANLGPRGQSYNNPEGRKVVLEQLINKYLFLSEAKKTFLEGDPVFKAELAKVKDELLANFAIEKAIANVSITDDEVKKFYEEHKSEFVAGEAVDASHILVDTEEKANEILADIKAGKIPFEDAAKQFSSCPSSENGGSLGEFTKGQMVPEFEAAAFTMSIGDISEPVKTQFGYHIIKLNGKKEPSEIPFEQIKPQIAQKVLSDKRQAAYTSKINQLKILFPVDLY